MTPSMTVGDAMNLKIQYGFSGFPVTASGEIGSTLVGLLTGRDFDFLESENFSKPITEVSEGCLDSHNRYACSDNQTPDLFDKPLQFVFSALIVITTK